MMATPESQGLCKKSKKVEISISVKNLISYNQNFSKFLNFLEVEFPLKPKMIWRKNQLP